MRRPAALHGVPHRQGQPGQGRPAAARLPQLRCQPPVPASTHHPGRILRLLASSELCICQIRSGALQHVSSGAPSVSLSEQRCGLAAARRSKRCEQAMGSLIKNAVNTVQGSSGKGCRRALTGSAARHVCCSDGTQI